MIKFSRQWAMPNANTFEIKPIADLLERWLPKTGDIVDPFARKSKWATVTNDLNPEYETDYNMDAVDFLQMLVDEGRTFRAALLDPPYSPRQISEVYKSIGLTPGMKDTQNARLYRECKERMTALLEPGGVAITCGWNSGGFGKKNGFVMREILLVPCGAAHNDYIVTVETKQGFQL